MTTMEQIVDKLKERQRNLDPWTAAAVRVRMLYNGDVMPLPGFGERDTPVDPAVPNVVYQGIEDRARRIASVQPNLFYPPVKEGSKTAEKEAAKKRKASLGWWQMNRMNIKDRRSARHFLGYTCTSRLILPDFKRNIPWWQNFDPLLTFPAPSYDPDDMAPPDCIFLFRQNFGWIKQHYPDQATHLNRKSRDEKSPALYDLVRYVDADEMVIGAIGAKRDAVTYWGETWLDGSEMVELERIPNRAGICPAVVAGAITLDRPRGQYDHMSGMYQMMQKLMWLNYEATKRGVTPNEVFVENESGGQVIQMPDGPKGIIGHVKNGTWNVSRVDPGYQTTPMVANLERNMRSEAGAPVEIGGECADEETEILTLDGWRRYNEVKTGDEVLTLNHQTGMSEWQPVTKMNVFNGTHDMVRMEGKSFSAFTTTNHKWPVLGWEGYRTWRTSLNMNANAQIPIAAMHADLPSEAKWEDALVETVAWFWTEGQIHKSMGGISQSIKHLSNVERIRAALRTLFGPPTPAFPRQGRANDQIPRWREDAPNSRGVINFHLSSVALSLLEQHAPKKIVTYDFLRALTLAQLELFIRVSLLADNAGPNRLGQKSKAMAEAFAYAGILAGRSVSYGTRLRTEARPGFRPGLYETNMVRFRERRVTKPVEASRRGTAVLERVSYDGVVWCPTTPNHTWFARRRGTTYFTGNSGSNIRTDRRGRSIMDAVVSLPVQEAQEIMAASKQEELKRAIAIDKAYFANVRKSFYVNWKGAKGNVEYTPGDLWDSDEVFVVYPSVGSDAESLGLQLMQMVGAGLMSKRTAMERHPDVEDAEMEHDRSIKDRLEEAFLVSLQTQLQQPGANLPAFAEIAKRVAANKEELFEAYISVHEELQAKQATSGEVGTPEGPTDPASPEAQPGLAAPGAGAEAGVAAPTAGSSGLAKLLETLHNTTRAA